MSDKAQHVRELSDMLKSECDRQCDQIQAEGRERMAQIAASDQSPLEKIEQLVAVGRETLEALSTLFIENVRRFAEEVEKL